MFGGGASGFILQPSYLREAAALFANLAVVLGLFACPLGVEPRLLASGCVIRHEDS
jgi:hypothetical protein